MPAKTWHATSSSATIPNVSTRRWATEPHKKLAPTIRINGRRPNNTNKIYPENAGRTKAQFKTMKYRPDFPGHFSCIEAARQHCQLFFPWYNDQHRHSGLGLHTPADVHYGTATEIRQQRGILLTAAYHAHPERFVRKPPEPPALPTSSWINPPDQKEPPLSK